MPIFNVQFVLHSKHWSISLFSAVYFNQGGSDDRGVHIRALFTELLRAKKPLVLHNGLIDMAFLYQVPVIFLSMDHIIPHQ